MKPSPPDHTSTSGFRVLKWIALALTAFATGCLVIVVLHSKSTPSISLVICIIGTAVGVMLTAILFWADKY
jgi:uncharacterized protein with PQ loop repeat